LKSDGLQANPTLLIAFPNDIARPFGRATLFHDTLLTRLAKSLLNYEFSAR
jgi:hypothetical protein